jgi:hypothetical protein
MRLERIQKKESDNGNNESPDNSKRAYNMPENFRREDIISYVDVHAFVFGVQLRRSKQTEVRGQCQQSRNEEYCQ